MIADGHHSNSHSLWALVDFFDFESIGNKNTIQFQGDALYDTNFTYKMQRVERRVLRSIVSQQ